MTKDKFDQDKLVGRTSQLIPDFLCREVTILNDIPLINRDNKVTKSTIDI